MAAVHNFVFSNLGNFKGWLVVGVPYASPYQISSKSIKWLRIYMYMEIFRFFQDGGRSPSWICGGHILGPSTKSTCGSLSSDKIWLEYLRRVLDHKSPLCKGAGTCYLLSTVIFWGCVKVRGVANFVSLSRLFRCNWSHSRIVEKTWRRHTFTT